MQKKFLAALSVVVGLSTATSVRASTYDFGFVGGGVSGAVELTYGTATDSRYTNAFVVTAISGTFSDFNIGIVNASIGPIEPLSIALPESSNLLAPHSFSHFTVASGLRFPPLSYDNLFWPAGSPQTASDYNAEGGILDIYGLLFDIGGGRVVNLWSNGGSLTDADYGVAVVTSAVALDYVTSGVVVPEPGSLVLLAAGIATLGIIRARPMHSKR